MPPVVWGCCVTGNSISADLVARQGIRTRPREPRIGTLIAPERDLYWLRFPYPFPRPFQEFLSCVARFPSLLLATAVVGCYSKSPEPAKVPLGQAAAPAAAPASGDVLTGPVLEQLNASPYVYLRIKTSKGEVWAAVPEAKVENGAEVTVVQLHADDQVRIQVAEAHV